MRIVGGRGRVGRAYILRSLCVIGTGSSLPELPRRLPSNVPKGLGSSALTSSVLAWRVFAAAMIADFEVSGLDKGLVGYALAAVVFFCILSSLILWRNWAKRVGGGDGYGIL